jgi:hypothetical protein
MRPVITIGRRDSSLPTRVIESAQAMTTHVAKTEMTTGVMEY